MNFVSIQFAAFFVAVLVVYWSLPRRAQHVLLLLASYLFYAAWDWRFLSLIVVSTLVDFLSGSRIHNASSAKRKRLWLGLSLLVNLGILGYFKYANFFLESLQALAFSAGWHLSVPTLQIILPVGISFYTFQTLSYSLDIYLGRLTPSRSIIEFGAFVAFFPQLVAGPIVRAREFLFQLEERRRFDPAQFERGAIRFLTGFFKKAVIADNLAIMVVDPVFAAPGDYGTGTLWLAAVAYSVQIYADFSGYSSMAIGCAAMLGFDLPENFRFPYLARDFSDFWRRWHMTMSRFFRDYVYIPLGGSHGSAWRTRSNLAATTVVSGLWHGASWTFVVWGGLHGVFIMVTHVLRSDGRSRGLLGGGIGWMLTFMGVLFAWILFRSPTFGDAAVFLDGLWGREGTVIAPTPLILVLLAAAVVDHLAGLALERAPDLSARIPPPLKAAWCVGLIVFAYHAMPRAANPFIYFQF
ncbi:MAG: MBOAT family protein [Longimicrobiales bacterium]|nr:MBOAT family protein [Longimicrobiales bacterium]